MTLYSDATINFMQISKNSWYAIQVWYAMRELGNYTGCLKQAKFLHFSLVELADIEKNFKQNFNQIVLFIFLNYFYLYGMSNFFCIFTFKVKNNGQFIRHSHVFCVAIFHIFLKNLTFRMTWRKLNIYKSINYKNMRFAPQH